MMAADTPDRFLNILSYNMHGFRQGCPVIEDVIKTHSPSVLLLQEHWLTPANLYKFDKHFSGYFSFGSSAMSNVVESGILRGRPFGGVITLISNELRRVTETVVCDERYVIVKIANFLIINVYLPCHGTANRLSICEDLVNDISSWCHQFQDCKYIVAGDFNCDLDGADPVAQCLNSFSAAFSLRRCDKLFPSNISYTYVNLSLNQYSYIDYVLVSCDKSVIDFDVLEPDINYSDHLPLYINVICKTSITDAQSVKNLDHPVQRHPRWDKADLVSYYQFTGCNLAPLLAELDNMLSATIVDTVDIDRIYDNIAFVLISGEAQFVPKSQKAFYKFWWNEELSILKQASIESNKLWKLAGKPHSGPIFEKRQASRLKYRTCMRQYEERSTMSYTNELHEALLRKNGTAFWKCWRSNFKHADRCTQVENSVDSDKIAERFAAHFSEAYKPNNAERSQILYDEYIHLRSTYCGLPLTQKHDIDTELVSNVISRLHRGKAADIVGLTAEHLLNSHPSLPVVLCKLFKLIMLYNHVPRGFRYSYIVPIPKVKDCRTKAMACNDFRGIAISPVISKVFEYCILDKFQNYLGSCDKQFGFKKGHGCRSAIYTVRKIVDDLNKAGSTVNMCAIDLSKAFDKVNHYALYIKLMKRLVPVELLEVLVNWLAECFTCIRWNNSWSTMFCVCSGVRQGSVLSPLLFAIYVDDIGKLSDERHALYVILYADDILLLSPSVSRLQKLLHDCEDEFEYLDMNINTTKTACLRIGPRSDKTCINLTTKNGSEILWVKEIRYLGIYIVRSTRFSCNLDHAKRSFYRAVNGIFAKIGRLASEEVFLQLIRQKCMPILLYGLDVCSLSKRNIQSLDFTVNRVLMKLFKTSNIDIISNCRDMFDIKLPSVQLSQRFDAFMVKWI